MKNYFLFIHVFTQQVGRPRSYPVQGMHSMACSQCPSEKRTAIEFRLTRLMWRGLHCFHGVHSNERVFTRPVIEVEEGSSGALGKCDGFYSGCSAYLVGRSEADTVGEQASPCPLHRAVVLPSMRGDSGDSARSSLGNHNAPVPRGRLLGGTFCTFGLYLSTIIMNIDTCYSCH